MGVPTQTDTKVKLTSHRYDCPSGPIADNIECIDKEFVLMYPFECKPDNPNTPQDDSETIYCDENNPVIINGKI